MRGAGCLGPVSLPEGSSSASPAHSGRACPSHPPPKPRVRSSAAGFSLNRTGNSQPARVLEAPLVFSAGGGALPAASSHSFSRRGKRSRRSQPQVPRAQVTSSPTTSVWTGSASNRHTGCTEPLKELPSALLSPLSGPSTSSTMKRAGQRHCELCCAANCSAHGCPPSFLVSGTALTLHWAVCL